MVVGKGLRLGPAHLHGQDVDQRQAVAVPRERFHRQQRSLQLATLRSARITIFQPRWADQMLTSWGGGGPPSSDKG